MKDLKILYLEDSSQDAEITARVLRKAGIPFKLKLIDKQEEYEQELKGSVPDLILSDHSMFQFNSVEALKIFKSFNYNIPFILVTGTVSEEFAVNILREGADDYLLKDNLSRLPNAILNALEKHRMERELKEHMNNIIANEALLKEAEHMAQYGSWQLNVKEGIMKWSDEAFRIYGYEPGEIEPSIDLFLKHIDENEKESLRNRLNYAVEKLDTFETEFRITDNQGKIKHLSFKIVIDRDDSGDPVRLVGFNHDITDQKVAEEKLFRSFQEVAKLEKELSEQRLYQQKIITEVTIQAQEKERDELAKELHDNINQVLATVKMFLNIAKLDPGRREELVDKSYGNVSYAIEEIRKLSKSLLSPSLNDMGIEEALIELASEINSVNALNVIINKEVYDDLRMDPKFNLMLYRIAQEQLNNILKYAKATEVIITLKITENNVFMSIADNGVGFDPGMKAKGIGLKNIKSRVEFYSGQLHILSSPGKGCTLEIDIPVS